MKTNLNSFERVVRFLLGLFLLFAAAILFKNSLARILVAFFGIFSLIEGFAGQCPAFAAIGVKDKKNEVPVQWLGILYIQLILTYAWWSAGWEKISSGEFIGGIAKTLGFFASKNPFGWYKSFLENFALPNASVFGYVVEWSQIAIAVCLLLTTIIIFFSRVNKTKNAVFVLMILALFGGLLMNANFYFAAGWTGPGTKGDNIIMFWTEAILMYVWISQLLKKK